VSINLISTETSWVSNSFDITSSAKIKYIKLPITDLEGSPKVQDAVRNIRLAVSRKSLDGSTKRTFIASQELHKAFQDFSSSKSDRALLVTIQNEELVPKTTIASSSPNLYTDLSTVQSHLSDKEALYILLRLDNSTLAAITFVPDAAPVRQKTLVASTRLTLLRELGSDAFAETLFATTAAELGGDGWRRHEAHAAEAAPLTHEERERQALRDAEAAEVGGTGRRGAGYGAGSSSGLRMAAGEGVVDALRALEDRALVLLRVSAAETVEFAGAAAGVAPADLAARISTEEPTYAFYQHSFEGENGPESAVIFIYTCPAAAPVKQRMIYASSKRSVETLAERDAGLKLVKKMEATDPSDITAKAIEDEFQVKQEVKTGFARPKRPGRR